VPDEFRMMAEFGQDRVEHDAAERIVLDAEDAERAGLPRGGIDVGTRDDRHRSLWPRQHDSQGEGGAAATPGHNRDVAPHRTGQLLHRAQPEPGSAEARRDVDVGLRERPKQALDLGERKPDAAVGDREGDTDRAFRARCRRGPQRDAAAFGKLHRIVDQVFQCRAETNRIADHEGGDLLRNLDGRAQTLGRCPARQRIAGVTGERAQVEKVPTNRQSGFAALRGVDEQGRQVGQMLRAGLDGIDPTPLALGKIGRCEEVADGKDSGERCTHLMCEGGERSLDHAG